MNFNEFAKWQAEKPKSRMVSIEINPTRFGEEKQFKVWAYDYDLATGQHVRNASEINLEEEKRREELEQLAALKAKYEPAA